MLADAVRQLGAGRVIATELDPWKVGQLTSNLTRSGLPHLVEIRRGDLLDTLRTLDVSVDFAFIDMWASGYLEAFRLLRPRLRAGSIVLAHSIHTAPEEVRGFKSHLEADDRLSTTTLDFESGIELTVVC